MTSPRTLAAAGAAGALLLTLAGARFKADPLVLVRLAVLGVALGSLVLYDLRERRIPNRIVLPATIICAALSLAAGIHQPSTGLLAAGGLVAVLLAVSLVAPAALGMGDVKLALMILCALGSLASTALLLTLEFYALAGVLLLARHGRSALGRTLPLAPLTAAGCLIALLV